MPTDPQSVDSIFLGALEKDRMRRYGSASQLAKGDAIFIGGTDNTVLNNIVHIETGYALNITDAGQPGFTSDYNLFDLQAAAVDLRGLASGEVLTGLRYENGHHQRQNTPVRFDEPHLPVKRFRALDQAFHLLSRPTRVENHKLTLETTLDTPLEIVAKHIAVKGLDEEALDKAWSVWDQQ